MGGDLATEKAEANSILAYSSVLLAADISPPSLVVRVLD